jgi:three-Cys-motif partner protein
MADGFFNRRREWSAYKHQILDKYLRIWVYKLAKTHPELIFLDGCAGEGAYGDGSEGSPLIAVKWNDEQVLRGYGHRLVVHACEPDLASFACLRLLMEKYTVLRPPRAVLYCERFETALPRILAAAGSVPMLVFIDPFAFQELEPKNLKPLLEVVRPRTEILFRADPTLLARWAGWLRERDRSPTARQAALRFRARLDRLLIDTESLTEAMEFRPDSSGVPKELLFQTYLQVFEERFKYVQWIPIRQSYHDSPKYYLIHCTDSAHGAAKINDTVSTMEDSMFAAAELKSLGVQTSMFEPARQLRVTIPEAKDTVRKFLSEGGQSFVEVCAHLAIQHGPDLREKDHRRIIKELVMSNQLVCEGNSLASATLVQLRL